jgi:hypothetical protein
MSTPNITRAIDDKKWLEWAQKKTADTLKTKPELKGLQERLLSLAGDWVALQDEPDLKALLERGRVFNGKIFLMHMKQCKCHRNCAEFWEKNQKNFKIATGWALSEEGIWRQHTWLLRGNAIVETTMKRIMYYGIVLDGIEASNFAEQHQPRGISGVHKPSQPTNPLHIQIQKLKGQQSNLLLNNRNC